jgi:prepilin-type processing-associated H-X9-DG protein
MTTYARQHDGKFPDRLGALVLDGSAEPALLICPATRDRAVPTTAPAEQAAMLAQPGHVSYTYTGAGLGTASSPECVLMYEPLDRHHDAGITVLFVDGRVTRIGQLEAAKALRRLSAGHNPPWSDTNP